MKQSDLENWFSYHAPTGNPVAVYATIRDKAKELAEMFNALAPDCADKTAAMRELRGTVMAMNLAIACNEPKAVLDARRMTRPGDEPLA